MEGVLHCARGGARPRPECELRAVERVLGPSCARARVEGQGGGAREPRAAAADVDVELHAAARHQARDVRPRASRRDEAHLAPRPVRPRRLEVRLLRHRGQPAHARPRHPALARGHIGVGERRHVVRALQPSQGRPTARGDVDDACTRRRDLRLRCCSSAWRPSTYPTSGAAISPVSRRPPRRPEQR